jgi:hypothetical protein
MNLSTAADDVEQLQLIASHRHHTDEPTTLSAKLAKTVFA